MSEIIVDDLASRTKARLLLKKLGFQYIQQLDWIVKKDGKWVIIEVKEKELFTPGTNYPHYGAGLDHCQLYLRNKLYEELGLRTYLLVFVKGAEDIYGAYLDELESKGEYYDTKNEIRIYPLENFTRYVWVE